MSSALHITYTPRSDATPEGEIAVLANVYAFILRCGEARRAEEMKKGTRPGAPDDGTKFKEDSANATIIPSE